MIDKYKVLRKLSVESQGEEQKERETMVISYSPVEECEDVMIMGEFN